MVWPAWLAQPLPVSTGTYIGLVWALAWAPMLVMTWRHRQGTRALILSPITALAGVGTAFVLALIAHYGLESGLGMSRRVSGHLWLLLMAPIGGFLFWRYVNYAKAPATWVFRGASVMDSAALVKQTRALKRKHGDMLLTLAGVFVNFDDEAKHFKIMGTTGSGKSTAIRELIGQALKRGDGSSVRLSVRDWIRSGRGVLFIPYQPEQIAALSSLIATWMRVAIYETMGLGEVTDPDDASRRL
jgi:hypothetical protein